ncbi:MAG: hypothetical protein Kow00120_17930 [Anaerolineae bacterium]
MSQVLYSRIRQKYLSGDYRDLFGTIMSVADEIGLDAALAHLEWCVTEKRLAWLDDNLASLARTGNRLHDAYRAFYESYLGIAPPADGEIVAQTADRIVTRWWNVCPVLDVCAELGLDTRDVCRKAYEKPVQAFLSRLHPGLRFRRDYDRIRPHAPYCEETIMLQPESGDKG